MNSDKIKQNIQATFDKVATKYDSNRFFKLSATQLVNNIALIKPNNILDLSTGTGIVALELAQKYPQANIEAIDLSEGMLAQAKSKAETANIKNIHFNQQDAEKLDYENEHFDLRLDQGINKTF